MIRMNRFYHCMACFMNHKIRKVNIMYQIIKKVNLNPTVVLMEILAPAVARKAQPGQFIILRADSDGERVPFTIADFNRETGTVTIIFQIVGSATEIMARKNEGDYMEDFVGPLGNATETHNRKKVAIIGGGVGCAIAYPVAKKFFEQGTQVHSVIGFRNKELVILEDEFEKVSSKLVVMSDDGTAGKKGLVTDALKELIESGEVYDEVIVIGPLVMMKFVCELTKKYGVKTVVSMNPVMIDGTGMCGGCRLTVGGEIKFACVDGPEFDGHLVDFDEAIARSSMYKTFEAQRREEACNLFNKEVE